METQEEFDFESFKREAISGLYSGKKMSGGDGVLASFKASVRIDVSWRTGQSSG